MIRTFFLFARFQFTFINFQRQMDSIEMIYSILYRFGIAMIKTQSNSNELRIHFSRRRRRFVISMCLCLFDSEFHQDLRVQ